VIETKKIYPPAASERRIMLVPSSAPTLVTGLYTVIMNVQLAMAPQIETFPNLPVDR
jgi:hypothetical protein